MILKQEMLLRLVRLNCAFLVAGAIGLALAGCSESEKAETRKNVDTAVDKTEDATVAAARKAAELAEKARDNTVNYFKSPDVKEDIDAAKQALKNAGSALGSTANDTAITASVSAAIARDPELGPRQIEVASKAGAEAKSRAEQIARTVNGVDRVDNQLTVTN